MFSGRKLDYNVVEQGLREIDPRFHFDVLTKHGWSHPYQAIRAGVWHEDRHISSVDRGVDKNGVYVGIPEFKQWESIFGWAEIQPSEQHLYDMVSMPYIEVFKSDEDYEEGLRRGLTNDWPYSIVHHPGETQKVVRHLHCRAWKERLGRVMYVGWRHTFENIVVKTQVTRKILGEKFGVDMFKYPVGPPEEVMAALVEE